MMIVNGIALHQNWMELARYFGSDMRWDWCNASDYKGEEDAQRYSSNKEFMDKTQVFIYQNIGLSIQGIHRPYIAAILELFADRQGETLIDVGAAGGQLGLAFSELGFRVSFADIMGNSMKFLLWRLAQRHLEAPVFVVGPGTEAQVPQHSVAVCFDVIEHLPENEQLNLIDDLAEWGKVVAVNLIRDERDDMHTLHYPVNFERLTDYIRSKWQEVHRDYYPDDNGRMKQRFIMYGSGIKAVQ